MSGKSWALFFARVILGLMFFMAGWHKVFTMGALEHARQLFVEPYAETFLPHWSLWATGVVIPFIELIAGGVLVFGWRVKPAAIALGCVLVIVTFGHSLADPFFTFNTHVLPRLLLLLFVLVLPREDDRLSLESVVEKRRG